MHRAREIFCLRWLPVLSWLCAAAASAAPVQSLFASIVPDADPQRAAQMAMREVLVRLVGTRDAADDPALAGLITDASRYVQLERGTTRGSTQVIFDGPALRAAVAATGRSIWDPDRPVVWVVLPALAGAGGEDLRAQLSAAAQARGLPIALVSAESAGGNGADAGGAAALLEAAHRAGAGAALIAQAPAADQPLQWTLVAPNVDGHWSGPAAAAIDGTTDALVRAARAIDATPASEYDCRIAGVNDLPSFTAVLDAVGSIPGVSDIMLRAVDADQLTLHFKSRGNPATITRALASGHLRPLTAGGDGVLQYRYQSGL